MRTFIPSGMHHILIGPDHILFLIGLLLLGGTLDWRWFASSRLHHRPQHHALAGGAQHRHAAGEHHRAGDRAEHRVRRRRQPGARRRPRPARLGGARLRAGARVRLRQRAARVRAAARGAWLVAVLVQPRRGDRSARASCWSSRALLDGDSPAQRRDGRASRDRRLGRRDCRGHATGSSQRVFFPA